MKCMERTEQNRTWCDLSIILDTCSVVLSFGGAGCHLLPPRFLADTEDFNSEEKRRGCTHDDPSFLNVFFV